MNTEAINVVLPKELKVKIKEMAIKKNISRNALIRLALTEFLERNS
jgi:metal-responsive CopG/Arc/MetJ family transcriptional regulator